MKLKKWQIIVAIICIILGILLHFTYEWSGENKFVGLFSAVNESTWEHLKLIFYPMLLMAIIGYFVIGKENKNYWVAQLMGILTAMAFTTIAFYTYTGIIGTNFAAVNIGLFIIAVILGAYVDYRILISKENYNLENISIILIVALFIIFILYTVDPPKIQYFKDPEDATFGINREIAQ